MSAHTRFHGDGTVTYWSVYQQVWRQNQLTVPEAELAAWSAAERSRYWQLVQLENTLVEVQKRKAVTS
jgi:hypothetical protein